jgi:hypothetical protein
MESKLPICLLSEPASCSDQVYGKLSHINICGGNHLNTSVKECPYREMYKISKDNTYKIQRGDV